MSGRPAASRTGRRGLSLLEMLVALAVLALITGGIASSLAFGRRAWERADRVHDQERQGASLRAMRMLLEGAERRPQGGTPPLQGEATSLGFLAAHPASAVQGAALARVRLWLEPGPGGAAGRLMLAITAAEPAQQGAVPAETRVLLQPVEGAAFSYLGLRRNTRQATWAPTWYEPDRLPDLVTLTLRRHRAPPLTIAIRPRMAG